MWEELHGRNFEIVSIDEDSKGVAAGLPWVEAAQPGYPVLLDTAHVVAELFGTKNVPTGVWIDEEGRIVRPAEVAWALQRTPGTEPVVHTKYLNALRDWVAKGSDSIYVLSDDAVQQRTVQSTAEDGQALAYFRLGVYLAQQGHEAEAVPYFKQAHLLKPDNWNLTRQAFNLGDPQRDYGTTLQQEIERIGPARAPLDMPDPPED